MIIYSIYKYKKINKDNKYTYNNEYFKNYNSRYDLMGYDLGYYAKNVKWFEKAYIGCRDNYWLSDDNYNVSNVFVLTISEELPGDNIIGTQYTIF